MKTLEDIKALLESLDLKIEQDMDDFACDFNDAHDSDEVFATCGASKCCLVFVGMPFVIKWSGYTGYGFNIDPNTGEVLDEAMDEVRIYEKAKNANLERFFPKTSLFCNINGINFIMQEKIDNSVADVHCYKDALWNKYENIGKTVTERTILKMQQSIDRVGSFSRTLNHVWAAMVVSLYGKAIAKKLCDFIVENSINDLHSDNIGFKNNKPILLDFSGYHRS